jgi:hypothetical protein
MAFPAKRENIPPHLAGAGARRNVRGMTITLDIALELV